MPRATTDGTIVGGEGGTDSDTLDLSGLAGAVTVTTPATSRGRSPTGPTRSFFSEIENFILSDQAETVAMPPLPPMAWMIDRGGDADHRWRRRPYPSRPDTVFGG